MKTQKNNISRNRLFFIDNIRLVMIILVVLVHTSVTYSGIGGWYYVENKSVDTASRIIFGMFNTFTQAYFMGFLFLIAGYFVPGSFDKKGAGRFIKDRLLRLGVPVLIYMFLINPYILYYLLGNPGAASHVSLVQFYFSYVSSIDFLGGTGPLWFALALLIFIAVYTLLRILGIKPFKTSSSKKNTPGNISLIIMIILISLLTFTVRMFYPYGTDVFNMQFCFFSQYIVLFILGILAYKKNWFLSISYKFGITWLKISLTLGLIIWLLLMILGGPLKGSEYVILGGLYWQSAVYALWEQLFCAGVCLGLIVIFREKFDSQGKFIKSLSDNAFGVFVLHPPILIAISLALSKVYIYPLLKFIIVGFIVIPVCFLFSSLVRKIPLLWKILS